MTTPKRISKKDLYKVREMPELGSTIYMPRVIEKNITKTITHDGLEYHRYETELVIVIKEKKVVGHYFDINPDKNTFFTDAMTRYYINTLWFYSHKEAMKKAKELLKKGKTYFQQVSHIKFLTIAIGLIQRQALFCNDLTT